MTQTYQTFMDVEIGRKADGSINGAPALDDALEALVDRFDMRVIVETLAAIADGKADHLRSNWQDDGAARRWEKVARKLDKATEAAYAVS